MARAGDLGSTEMMNVERKAHYEIDYILDIAEFMTAENRAMLLTESFDVNNPKLWIIESSRKRVQFHVRANSFRRIGQSKVSAAWADVPEHRL
ncbi:MAG: hypothetical protein IT548_06540 [Alphaproteobacteria bacterium]|nr:hypothetical protein [Alphaproteobacteria bacterium]